jgi:tripeptide aminopeptidase
MNNVDRLVELATAIQQIPAPTFHERERAEFILGRFKEELLADVEMDALGDVYGRLAGRGAAKPLVVSAHLDTVFPPSVDLRCEREADRIRGAGIGDNSVGVAALLGLAWELRQHGTSLPGDVWLVANVCEEGLGDLKGMRAVVERFGAGARAYLVLEGMALGTIYHRGLGVKRYRIGVRTSGGHSWLDYGKPSAIHELTTISNRLAGLTLPRSPRTTLNIGVIAGGSSVNTIAAEAMLELDLRSEEAGALESLAGQVLEITGAAKKPGVDVKAELIGQRPTGELPAAHPLVKLAQEALREAGVEARLNIGSTDANLPLSLGYPAVTIGLTTGGGGHTVHEYIHSSPLKTGMRQLVNLVRGVFEL